MLFGTITDTFNMPARDTSGNNFTENEKMHLTI